MRVALKIAYDGRAFYGHQRQPDARTVEGECLAALEAARIIRDPRDSFFRSASRTDRGVSAVGNVIAFDSTLASEDAVGAFNDHAREVWAWGSAAVPERFHPRHAVERWYRYHLFEDAPIRTLQRAADEFAGVHDFRWFTSDPISGPSEIRSVHVARERGLVTVDVRARSFRRAMVRRIVSAIVAVARGDAALNDVREALRGARHDFGVSAPEPLFLMDVAYDFPFRAGLRSKALGEWRRLVVESTLRLRWLGAVEFAVATATSACEPGRNLGTSPRGRAVSQHRGPKPSKDEPKS